LGIRQGARLAFGRSAGQAWKKSLCVSIGCEKGLAPAILTDGLERASGRLRAPGFVVNLESGKLENNPVHSTEQGEDRERENLAEQLSRRHAGRNRR
jgi:hypothetical protein